ncbi:tetratricopeptide repeat protein [bacterium]|nr:tetratricopeptide repeat protein [bacterium]
MNNKALNAGLFGHILACGFVITALSVNAQVESKDYVEPDFSSAAPVRMEILQDGGKRKLGARFVRPSSTGIEIEMLQGDGAIIVGWDHMEQFTINIPITEDLEIALAHPDPERKVELLEKEIWPLLPLASIRSESTNVHILINAYVEAVIRSKNWLQGYAMSQYMALNRSPEETVRHLYTVAENLFTIGEEEKALTLIDQLIAARPGEESREFSLNVAKRLLDLRLFEPALRLYRSIAEGGEPLEKKKALLNSSYLCLELGQYEDADAYFAKATAIEESDAEARGSEFLSLGVKAFHAGDPNLALNHLGHAMAVINPSSHIKQAGLYFTFLCYTNQDLPEIAKNIVDEMGLLFPGGAYLALLENETTDTTYDNPNTKKTN